MLWRRHCKQPFQGYLRLEEMYPILKALLKTCYYDYDIWHFLQTFLKLDVRFNIYHAF